MANHTIDCRGCGADLRLIGGNHEANCLASKLNFAEKAFAAARATAHDYEDKLNAFTSEALQAQTKWHERNKELESRLGSAESELRSARYVLGAFCKANGGEAYISRRTLAALSPTDEIERRDEPDGGIYYRLVERHAPKCTGVVSLPFIGAASCVLQSGHSGDCKASSE